MDISDIGKTILDQCTKGIPDGAAPFALKDIAQKSWNVLNEDMPLPLMVLKRDNLAYNNDLFAKYLTDHDLSLAPHGKTTMSPQIFARQIQHGAWGITAATVDQMLVMRKYGVQRIVLANQIIGKSNITAVVNALNSDPDFEFYCFVDSIDQLQHMARHLVNAAPTRPINLLVEIGAMGGRTGIRSKLAALALVADILALPELFRFSGIGAFEGAIPGLDKGSAPVHTYAELVLEVARNIPAAALSGLDEFILTGGGSAYFDIIADHFKKLDLSIPVRTLLRSGCYVTNDHGAYRAAQEEARFDPDRHWTEKFRPALEVWAYVQSIPEPDLAFLTMGKRDVPFDAGFPVPFKRYRPGFGFLDIGEAEVFATNDQHSYVRLGDASDWRVGDMICSGISHPCTAFDKWRFVPIVDDDYNVVDGLLTFF